ncbi:hypothetical protein [Novosphingobium sp. KACC 22771]|uniref:hypothetical protein n=1 Tax=Novosphingobium sp. KACC 22771 TaxID=3025670 RepID=UPI0023670E9F|nr:hypothetical protein [Novosphingobium sp. KACC 22771]WDF72093.1 hypothetical protein PQ467_15050 [Novosphingobium sp. KACC 22771]
MFAVFHPILTAARILRNRLFPVDGIDLLMRLDIVGDAGLGPEDLTDLGPEGVTMALRWLSALSADGLVDLVVGGRYCLTGRGQQAVFLMARGAAQ